METFVGAFLGGCFGSVITLGLVNLANNYFSYSEARRNTDKLIIAINEARKAGVPVSYEATKN